MEKEANLVASALDYLHDFHEFFQQEPQIQAVPVIQQPIASSNENGSPFSLVSLGIEANESSIDSVPLVQGNHSNNNKAVMAISNVDQEEVQKMLAKKFLQENPSIANRSIVIFNRYHKLLYCSPKVQELFEEKYLGISDLTPEHIKNSLINFMFLLLLNEDAEHHKTFNRLKTKTLMRVSAEKVMLADTELHFDIPELCWCEITPRKDATYDDKIEFADSTLEATFSVTLPLENAAEACKIVTELQNKRISRIVGHMLEISTRNYKV